MASREQVERVLKQIENGWRFDASFELVGELCRAWLAMDAAPIGTVGEVGKFERFGDIIEVDFEGIETGLSEGQRVRLVPVEEGE